ncbi:hypothetical protein [Brevibacillus laterosporus]|uniref:hypothetical protein n=1 Tax=Brevibacillus laterosporus TaxID=1465 RepID=UPI000A44088C|nr:hypothetical protein [Brevibacillus laterosporus]
MFDTNENVSHALATELTECYPTIEVRVACTVEQAVHAADVLVTATVSSEPYIPFDSKRYLYQQYLHYGSS